MPLTDSAYLPVSAYRLQLHGGFTFDDLRERLPYFRALGIRDFYLSPIFTATPGSLHGYDVNDYGTVNRELGGRAGFERLTEVLRAEGLGVIVDFVPNHMGIAGPLNQWWREVLEMGRDSPYAEFFDIQWKIERDEKQPRVLVPVLEDHYGKMLEQGKISVAYDGDFSIRYADVVMPMNPASHASILAPLAKDPALTDDDRREIVTLVTAFLALPKPVAGGAEVKLQRTAEVERVKTRLREFVGARPKVAAQLALRLRTLNGRAGEPASFSALHALIDEQHYRLARWKTGAHEINYRRFFAIDSLIGLHMQKPAVFRAVHELLAQLIIEGRVSGLRIDHIDGLREPENYLRALQSLDRPQGNLPLYVLVEKILETGEDLPGTWATQGTTGYEFIPQLAGLFVDAATEKRFDEIYGRFTGETRAYADLVYDKKHLIIAEMFANAVSNLGADLVQLVAADWRWQDLTRHELTTAVSELIANLSVYRTYRQDGRRVSTQDQHVLELACSSAIARNPLADPHSFEFVRDLLVGVYPPSDAPEEYQRVLLGWVLTFQQYTGAVMAKTVEDTAFYNYCRLIALNEVGGDPAQFGGTVTAFHEANRVRLERSPLSLLTTSTHDTKLSEDVRARLYALSEIPGEWSGWIANWHRLNVRHLTTVDGGEVPDALDEYRFYQVLLGAWPLDEADVNDAFRARLRQHFRKAVEEAKRRTAMLHPNEAYLAACERFVDAIVSTGESSAEFMASFRVAARRVARLGMTNSLAQVILKCTVPGVPDFYQGNETWDFSLVDPDNRRAVDYARRAADLEKSAARSFPELLENWRDGAIKLRVTQTLLQFRAAHRELFARGRYTANRTSGAFADNVVAFTRAHGNKSLLVIVPRLTAKLGSPPLGTVWDDTAVDGKTGSGRWRNLFDGREFSTDAPLPLRQLFADTPFAVLETI